MCAACVSGYISGYVALGEQDSLDLVKAIVDSLFAALESAACRQGTPEIATNRAPLPPTLNWTISDMHLTDPAEREAVLQWTRFDLIAGLGRVDTEVFAGGAISVQPDLFANLLAYQPAAVEAGAASPATVAGAAAASAAKEQQRKLAWKFADVEAAFQQANKQVCRLLC